ncbi:MAG TPA: S8 family serine peptidase [Phycisphaerales bacterium]|nr:S8 family serine peptidase [Phycisphaerales bacterium]HMP35835.1 S8 family serine peptidase [Phycisphaerales bacterium]
MAIAAAVLGAVGARGALASGGAIGPAPGAGAQPALVIADLALDEPGGAASTHVLVRIAPGRSIVARPGMAPELVGVGERERASAEAVLARYGAEGARRTLSVEPRHRDRAESLGLDRVWTITVPAGTATPALVEELRATGAFEHVEVDGIGGVATAPPNDPLFTLQYALRNVGQFVQGQGGLSGADIDAIGAWAIAEDLSEVVVAVLDSGVHQHVDLAGRLLPGWNVPDQSNVTVDACASHGTHVSGILAALRDNGIGIAGVARNVKVLPVVVVNPCNGLESWLADGIIWAVDNGADVINMSLQYSVGSDYLRIAVQYAAAAGAVMVAAAGNSNAAVAFPARWPETIAVAATDNTDTRWSSSNFGPELDVAAPGWQIHSLTGTSGYGYKTGTSMATPHVSGLVAMLRGFDPSLDAGEIRAIVASGADDVSVPGFDIFTGHGRINAATSMAMARPGPNAGDLNGDGFVNAIDLALILSAWGPCVNCELMPCFGDLDGSCEVDGADLAIVLSSWSV